MGLRSLWRLSSPFKLIIGIVIVLLPAGFLTLHNMDFNQLPAELRGLTGPVCVVEKVVLYNDKDGDGVYDLDDIVQGARKDLEARPAYKDAYYAGGYPPENEGVCTDVIWRALQNAGYDLKGMMDRDIREHLEDYPRVAGAPEPNIDFRRVPNQEAFFKKYAEQLTTQIKPWDAENLKQWQGGDIVVFGPPHDHVGVVSDKRRADGVPLLIHNAGPSTREDNGLLNWSTPIKYHFRFSKNN
ncbi:DUF1287 domain-containing protein [Pelotomaculum sp. PtaB.Bin117]|uniref:DUF1287 domain-containing protein n=2 Tax=Pelotomaculum TaxID=191373 RepID=UPI0009CAAEF3|nr:DUF1287 domain-containing protein [Pelotomaculum sp. PtaB.Bin117]OPX90340.1 MAG: hypothetical protein A4E54_00711 [Pelotomaculum sp. PtaB.Bin117]OPY60940.1 MAG: hypothetical protein A4E56_02365 [Pelotomaculum sp. PtaU1.Bin065]